MPLLRLLARDRRVLLAALLAVLVLVLSRLVFSPTAAMMIVVKGGYWAALLAAGYFAYVGFRVVRRRWQAYRWVRHDTGMLCLILACGTVLLSHERYGFKILSDEVLLLGTSMGMHYDRDVAYPTRATNVQGPFLLLSNVMDKRPFFYPFVVALVHDLTGYRPENAFYVNTALGFLFLSLVYLIGRRVAGSPWAGALLVLLFSGLPLLGQQMKGGGFELLNLVMLSAVLLLGMEYAERRDEESLDAFVYAAVLLAFTRYESIVMLVPVAALVIWGWWREQRVVLSWPAVLSPMWLTFPLLQNRVFTANSSAWELAGKPGATVPFSPRYFAENAGHALGFFFDTTGYQPNSPLFAAVGLLAAAFLLVWTVRVLRRPAAAAPKDVATAIVALGLFAIWAVLMAYFWGQFDDPVIRRLSLPVHLLMAIAIAAVGASLVRNARAWQVACGVAVAGLLLWSLPMMSRRAYAASYSPLVEMEWRADFLRRFPERDYLFIDNDSVFWITHHVAATPNLQAKEREEGILYHLRNDSFSAIYVMQHFRVDQQTGQRKLEPNDDIGPDYQLEPVWERRIETLFIGRISRVTAIRPKGQPAVVAGPIMPKPEGKTAGARTPEQWDAAKGAYVEHWLKELP